MFITTSLYPYNNSVSANSTAFKFYYPKYLVMILSCVLASSKISQKVLSVTLSLLLHFRSWFVSSISCIILRVNTLTRNISVVGDNIGIVCIVYLEVRLTRSLLLSVWSVYQNSISSCHWSYRWFNNDHPIFN